MKKGKLIIKKLLFFAGILIFIYACKKESSGEIQGPEVLSFTVIDAGNSQNSSDIYFRAVMTPKEVDKVRIVFVPTPEAGVFKQENSQALLSESYEEFRVNVNSGVIISQLTNGLKDSGGSDLIQGQPYTVHLITITEDNAILSDKTVEFTLTDANPLIGEYIGLWNDAIYTNFQISLKITNGDADSANGVLYYSGNFTPCCSNPSNDGTISFDYDSQTNKIETFRYNQKLANYLGGECNAVYSGDGEVKGLRLLINYTGSDCDGDHGDGLINVERRW